MMYYSGINAFVWCLAIATVAIAVYYATQVVISWLSWRGECKENASQAFFLRHYADKLIKEFSDSIIALKDKVAKLEKRLGVENENKEYNADKEVLNEKGGQGMNKVELEQYARENRKRLEAQEVRLGDVVKVLNGRFASEQGVVYGIIAIGKSDFDDPYYEVEMEHEVPEMFRSRKNTLVPNKNNIVGGFSKCDLEVIGNLNDKSDD